MIVNTNNPSKFINCIFFYSGKIGCTNCNFKNSYTLYKDLKYVFFILIELGIKNTVFHSFYTLKSYIL